MKKKIFAAGMAAVMTASAVLTGCGSGGSGETAGTQTQAEASNSGEGTEAGSGAVSYTHLDVYKRQE